MIGVRCPLLINLQLTTFVLLMHDACTLQTWGQSRTTRHTHTRALSTVVALIGDHTTSYPSLQQQ